MSDVNYAERARRMADGMSAQLTDERRAAFLKGAAPAARSLLDLAKDRESACALAILIATISLTLTVAGNLSDTLDAYNATFSLAAGITAGSIPMPPDEDDPVTRFADPALIKMPSDLTGPYL